MKLKIQFQQFHLTFVWLPLSSKLDCWFPLRLACEASRICFMWFIILCGVCRMQQWISIESQWITPHILGACALKALHSDCAVTLWWFDRFLHTAENVILFSKIQNIHNQFRFFKWHNRCRCIDRSSFYHCNNIDGH